VFLSFPPINSLGRVFEGPSYGPAFVYLSSVLEANWDIVREIQRMLVLVVANRPCNEMCSVWFAVPVHLSRLKHRELASERFNLIRVLGLVRKARGCAEVGGDVLPSNRTCGSTRNSLSPPATCPQATASLGLARGLHLHLDSCPLFFSAGFAFGEARGRFTRQQALYRAKRPLCSIA
jgi:hypothetical protein